MVRDVRAWRSCVRRVGGLSGFGGSARENLLAGENGHGNRGDWGLCVVGNVVQCDEWNDASFFGRHEAAQTLGDAHLGCEHFACDWVRRLSENDEGPGLPEDK